MDLRGPAFRQELNLFLRIRQHHLDPAPKHRFNVVIMFAGAPACGMNAAAKAIARDFFNGGHTVYGAIDGFEGLAKGDLMEMKWDSVKVRAAALCGACWSCSRPGGLFAWRIAPCFFLSLQVVSSSA